jgi:steroid 5-alpha reductase family enzyme
MELLIVNIAIVASLIWIIVTGVFFLAQVLEDNSVMDIFYGPIFFAVAFLFIVITETTSVLPAIITACMGLWAIRLGGRIFMKNFGKPEDARYAKWRREWTARGRWYFFVRSYLQISLLQGFIILLVLMPFIVSTTTTLISPSFAILGGIVFLLGLTLETTADWQLDRFIARKRAGTETATLMTQGVFKYSRRPNYFGESLIWWGLALMVLPLPFGWLGLISPLVITYVLTRITGPMLEKQFLERHPEEYRQYMATTNFFIPGPPKKST